MIKYFCDVCGLKIKDVSFQLQADGYARSNDMAPIKKEIQFPHVCPTCMEALQNWIMDRQGEYESKQYSQEG